MSDQEKTWILCKYLKDDGEHKSGEEIHIEIMLAESLVTRGIVEVLFDQIDPDYIAARIIDMAEKRKELLVKLIIAEPDDLKRHAYKRELKKLQSGDLRP